MRLLSLIPAAAVALFAGTALACENPVPAVNFDGTESPSEGTTTSFSAVAGLNECETVFAPAGEGNNAIIATPLGDTHLYISDEAGSSTWTDVLLSVQLDLSSGCGPDKRAGLVFRYAAGNYYSLAIDQSNKELVFAKMVSDTYTVISSKDIEAMIDATPDYFTLSVYANGDDFEFSVSAPEASSETMVATDPALAQGSAGLLVHDLFSQTTFEKLKITADPCPPPSLKSTPGRRYYSDSTIVLEGANLIFADDTAYESVTVAFEGDNSGIACVVVGQGEEVGAMTPGRLTCTPDADLADGPIVAVVTRTLDDSSTTPVTVGYVDSTQESIVVGAMAVGEDETSCADYYNNAGDEDNYVKCASVSTVDLTFDGDDDGANWEKFGCGSWSNTEEDDVVGVSPHDAPTVYVTSDVNTNTGEIVATVTPSGGCSPTKQAGIAFNFVDGVSTTYFAFALDVTNQRYILISSDDGVETLIAETAATTEIVGGTGYTVKLEISATSVVATVDDAAAGTYTIPASDGGAVGFYANDFLSVSKFDDLSVGVTFQPVVEIIQTSKELRTASAGGKYYFGAAVTTDANGADIDGNNFRIPVDPANVAGVSVAFVGEHTSSMTIDGNGFFDEIEEMTPSEAMALDWTACTIGSGSNFGFWVCSEIDTEMGYESFYLFSVMTTADVARPAHHAPLVTIAGAPNAALIPHPTAVYVSPDVETVASPTVIYAQGASEFEIEISNFDDRRTFANVWLDLYMDNAAGVPVKVGSATGASIETTDPSGGLVFTTALFAEEGAVPLTGDLTAVYNFQWPGTVVGSVIEDPSFAAKADTGLQIAVGTTSFTLSGSGFADTLVSDWNTAGIAITSGSYTGALVVDEIVDDESMLVSFVPDFTTANNAAGGVDATTASVSIYGIAIGATVIFETLPTPAVSEDTALYISLGATTFWVQGSNFPSNIDLFSSLTLLGGEFGTIQVSAIVIAVSDSNDAINIKFQPLADTDLVGFPLKVKLSTFSIASIISTNQNPQVANVLARPSLVDTPQADGIPPSGGLFVMNGLNLGDNLAGEYPSIEIDVSDPTDRFAVSLIANGQGTLAADTDSSDWTLTFYVRVYLNGHTGDVNVFANDIAVGDDGDLKVSGSSTGYDIGTDKWTHVAITSEGNMIIDGDGDNVITGVSLALDASKTLDFTSAPTWSMTAKVYLSAVRVWTSVLDAEAVNEMDIGMHYTFPPLQGLNPAPATLVHNYEFDEGVGNTLTNSGANGANKQLVGLADGAWARPRGFRMATVTATTDSSITLMAAPAITPADIGSTIFVSDFSIWGVGVTGARGPTIEDPMLHVDFVQTSGLTSSPLTGMVYFNSDQPEGSTDVITVTCSSSAPAIASVDPVETEVELTFDALSMQTPQPLVVSFTPGSEGDATITCTASVPEDSDHIFHDVVTPVLITVADPGITAFDKLEEQVSTAITIAGPKKGITSFSISLDAAPIDNAIVQVKCTGNAGPVASPEDKTFFFNKNNFSQKQVVKVTANTASGVEGTVLITCAVQSASGGYNGEAITALLSLTNSDVVLFPYAEEDTFAQSEGDAYPAAAMQTSRMSMKLAAAPFMSAVVEVECETSDSSIAVIDTGIPNGGVYVFVNDNDEDMEVEDWYVLQDVFVTSIGTGVVDVTCSVQTATAGGFTGAESATVTFNFIQKIQPTVAGLDNPIPAGGAPVTITITVPANKEVTYDIDIEGTAEATITPASKQIVILDDDDTTEYTFTLTGTTASSEPSSLILTPIAGKDKDEFATLTRSLPVKYTPSFVVPPASLEVGAGAEKLIVAVTGSQAVTYIVKATGDAEVELTCGDCGGDFDPATNKLQVRSDDGKTEYAFYIEALTTEPGAEVVVQLTADLTVNNNDSPALNPFPGSHASASVRFAVVATCFGISSTDVDVCNGLGDCIGADDCSCGAGFNEACDACASGYFGFPHCTPLCASACPTNAACVPDNGVASCECNPGYTDGTGDDEGTCVVDTNAVFSSNINGGEIIVSGDESDVDDNASDFIRAHETIVLTAPTNAGLTGTTYSWSVDNGGDLSSVDTDERSLVIPGHTIPAGTYEFTVMATLPGGASGSITVDITVDPAPAPGTLTVSPGPYVADGANDSGTEVTFTASSFTNSPVDYDFFYRWSANGDDIEIPNDFGENIITYTFPTAGEVWVGVYVVGALGSRSQAFMLGSSIVIEENESVYNVPTALSFSESKVSAFTGGDDVFKLVQTVTSVTARQLQAWPATQSDEARHQAVAAEMSNKVKAKFDSDTNNDTKLTVKKGKKFAKALKDLSNEAASFPDTALVNDETKSTILETATLLLESTNVVVSDDFVAVVKTVSTVWSDLICLDSADVGSQSFKANSRKLKRTIRKKLRQIAKKDGIPATIETDDVAATVAKVSRGNHAGSYGIKTQSRLADVTVPDAALAAHASLSAYDVSIFQQCQNTFRVTGFSRTVSIEIHDSGNDATLPIAGLNTQPILVQLRKELGTGVGTNDRPVPVYLDDVDGIWKSNGLSAVEEVAGGFYQFTTPHLTEFALTTGCLNDEDGETRGFLADNGICACSSGYLSDLDTDCNIKEIDNVTCDVKELNENESSQADHLPVIDVDNTRIDSNSIVITVDSNFVEEATIVDISLRPRDDAVAFSDACSYPGANWEKYLDLTGDCQDTFESNINFVLATTADATGCGLEFSELADTYEYTGLVAITTNQHLTLITGEETDRTTETSYTLTVSLPKTIEITSDELLVFGDAALVPQVALTAQSYDQFNQVATLTYTTRLAWPLKLDAFHAALPNGIEITPPASSAKVQVGQVVEDASDCTDDEDTICLQTWTFTLDPVGDCTLSGEYEIGDQTDDLRSYQVVCRDESNTAICPLVGTEYTSFTSSISSENFCGVLTIEDENPPTATLSLFSDEAHLTPKTSFLTGDTVYFALDVSEGEIDIEEVEITNVDVGPAGAQEAFYGESTPDTYEPTTLGNAYAFQRPAQTPTEFHFTLSPIGGGMFDIDNEPDPQDYLVTVNAVIVYVDGTRKRSLLQATTANSASVEAEANVGLVPRAIAPTDDGVTDEDPDTQDTPADSTDSVNPNGNGLESSSFEGKDGLVIGLGSAAAVLVFFLVAAVLFVRHRRSQRAAAATAAVDAKLDGVAPVETVSVSVVPTSVAPAAAAPAERNPVTFLPPLLAANANSGAVQTSEAVVVDAQPSLKPIAERSPATLSAADE